MRTTGWPARAEAVAPPLVGGDEQDIRHAWISGTESTWGIPGSGTGRYNGTMSDTSTELLPLLPLTQGVVFPQMVVTIALETDEAKRAGAAAERRRRPHRARAPGRRPPTPRSAPSPQIESAGDLPNGTRALVIRGVGRAARRHRRDRRRTARSTCRSSRSTNPTPTPRARELAREYRAVVETILEHRGARRIADVLAGVDDPGQLADTAAYSPDLTHGAAGRAARDDRRRGAAGARVARGRARRWPTSS